MNFCKLGLAVIETEAQAVFELAQRIDHRFEEACKLLLACKGRIVVTGMGKSGHIGKKRPYPAQAALLFSCTQARQVMVI